MLKILAFFLFSLTLLHAQSFQACGTNETEAKANLAAQVISTIESSFQSHETVSQSLFSFASKEAKRNIKSHSKLTLSDIKFSTIKNKVCASIDAKTLVRLAKGKLKAIRHYDFKKMPKEVIAHINMLESRLDEVNQALAITKVLPSYFNDEELETLQKMKSKLLSLRSTLHAQKVSFNVTPRGAKLLIDEKLQNRLHNIYLSTGTHSYTLRLQNYAPYTGSFSLEPRQARTIEVNLAGHRYPEVRFALSSDATLILDGKKVANHTPYTLKPGRHSYEVYIPNHCPLKEGFSMNLGETKTIEVNPQTLSFPTLTITSNRLNAKLSIQAKAYSLGKAKTFKVCQKTLINYSVDFQGQIKNDTISLEPGQSRTINVDFLTLLDIKALRAQARTYQNKKRYVFRMGEDFYNLKKALSYFGFDSMKHRSWLRYGWGFSYANDGSNKSASLHYSASLQLTDFGAKKLPLYIASYALMPYVGIQGGIEGSNFADKKYGALFKLTTGVDFVLNSTIGIELFMQKNLFYTQEFVFGLALSLKDPF